jgi:HK97 gp10 family phage protein
MTNTVRIEGLEEIRRRMNNMASDLKRRILIDAMKRAMKPAMQAAQANTPKGRRDRRGGKGQRISQNVYTGPRMISMYRIKKMRSDNPFLLEVQLQNTAYYSGWVELGHRVVRGRKKKKKVVGHSPAQNFLKKTFDAEKNSIVVRLANEIRAGLFRRGF